MMHLHMTDEQISLYKRLGSSPLWKWKDGCNAIRLEDNASFRIIIAWDCYEDYEGTAEWANVFDGKTYIPYLKDAATLGILINTVREHLGYPASTFYITNARGDMKFGVANVHEPVWETLFSTEEEALISSLGL